MPHKIRDIPELAQYADSIEAIGYETIEKLLGLAKAVRYELEDYLGSQVIGFLSDDFSNSLTSAASNATPISTTTLNIFNNSIYSTGVALHKIPPIKRAFSSSFSADGALPNMVNLISAMSPIRNQEGRETCVAFSALAAFEHYLSVYGAPSDLSEQFLYWNCKKHDNYSGGGTWLETAMPLLRRDGCCLEANWQYNPILTNNEGQGPPPPGAIARASTYKVASIKALAPTYVDEIKNELAQNRCVPFSTLVFNSWLLNDEVAKSGDIEMPVPGELPNGGHAMCIVGYKDDPSLLPAFGGGKFIIRNSWGDTWGIESSVGTKGYGTIPYAYIAKYGKEAYSI